jgi:Phage integrase family
MWLLVDTRPASTAHVPATPRAGTGSPATRPWLASITASTQTVSGGRAGVLLVGQQRGSRTGAARATPRRLPAACPSLFARRAWLPAAAPAGLPGTSFHGLRHGFVAILVAAGCNVREVSEWAGHNNVAFTLARYGGLFEDGSDGV